MQYNMMQKGECVCLKRLWLFLMAAVLLFATLLAGCGKKEKETLIMATESTFPPYEYLGEGSEVVGVDVDIAREIAAELGMELVIEDMAFEAIPAAVDTGKADFGAAGLSITPERLETVDFSIEYATSKQVVLTTADSDVMGPADLDGKTVGVQLGTVADLELSGVDDDGQRNYPGVTVQQYNKYTEAVSDLKIGRIDAIVLDFLPAQEYLNNNEGLAIREEELFTDRYAFCVQKGNTELLEQINSVLQRLIDEGKIEEFTQNHLTK